MENNASLMLIWVYTDTVYTSAGSCQFWNRTLIISTRRTWEVSSSFNVSSAIVGFLHSASAASPFSAPSRSWSHDDTRLFREHMHLSITGYKFPSVRPLLSLLWAFCLISHPLSYRVHRSSFFCSMSFWTLAESESLAPRLKSPFFLYFHMYCLWAWCFLAALPFPQSFGSKLEINTCSLFLSLCVDPASAWQRLFKFNRTHRVPTPP